MKTLLLLCFSLITFISQGQITWSSATNVASSTFGNDHPRIVMDGSGNPLVLWGDLDNAMSIACVR